MDLKGSAATASPRRIRTKATVNGPVPPNGSRFRTIVVLRTAEGK